MKRKARIQSGVDDRLVAIYARKSRITNKGDSIGVQFKQSADYAINQLSLPEDYDFTRYEDKGLSGYYSDRPDFQRLLRDIEMGKIKAVACYKLDRISRKTSDLMRLLEYFERHDVTLWSAPTISIHKSARLKSSSRCWQLSQSLSGTFLPNAFRTI